MAMGSEHGFSFESGVWSKMNPPALHGINQLKAINVHLLFLKVGFQFDACSRVFKIFGGNDEVHMGFVHAVQYLQVVKPAMDDEKLHVFHG